MRGVESLVTRPQHLPSKPATNYLPKPGQAAMADKVLVSMLQDDTLCEPSAYFDENVIDQTVLHQAHMVERYAIPAKRQLEGSVADKQTARLNELINQVKQDVSVNQSRIGLSKCQSMTMANEESELPNVTNEELHISNMVTKVPMQ